MEHAAEPELGDKALEALRQGEFDKVEEIDLEDEEQIGKMLWALTHLRREQDRLEALFQADLAVLQEQHASELAVLMDRKNDLMAGPAERIEDLDRVITGWHKAVVADAEARGVKKLPITRPFPAGTLKSRKGSTKVTIDDPEVLIEWLKANGHGDLVKIKETVTSTSVKERFFDSETGRFFDSDGELLPGISAEVSDRKYIVELG